MGHPGGTGAPPPRVCSRVAGVYNGPMKGFNRLLRPLGSARPRGKAALCLLAVLLALMPAWPPGVGHSGVQAGIAPSGINGGELIGPSPQFTLGEDEVICLGRWPTVIGTAEDDLLTGTPGPDVINGRQGNDIIHGFGGDDFLCGGSGDDQIYGGDGRDFIRGWSGDDFINAGPGHDTVLADRGNDHLIGEGGRDFLSGSLGDDIIFAGHADLRDGDISWLIGNDVLLGGQGVDIIIGDPGNDAILAFGGDDFIATAGGNDYISGHSGNDYIDAGRGAEDVCDGGSGVDTAANCEFIEDIERRGMSRFPFLR